MGLANAVLTSAQKSAGATGVLGITPGGSATRPDGTPFQAGSLSIQVLLSNSGTGAASANVALIQAALTSAKNAGGGTVELFGSGVCYTNATLVISSGTTLRLQDCLRLTLTGGTAKNMLVNENWNSPLKAVSSVSTADGKTVTVVFPAAHGFSVGAPFFLIGCVPDAYNGVWSVKSVSTTAVANDTLTYTLSSHLGTENPAITSPATVNPAYSTTTYFGTTTILACAADENITIEGGIWDAQNGSNGGTNYLTFGWYLRRIANLKIRSVDWRNCRNPIVPCNIYGGSYDNIVCRNIGSLIQNSGSCRSISIGTLRGDAWDDHTTFLIGDWAGYADVSNGVLYGDMSDISVAVLQLQNGYRFTKLVGQSNFRFGTVSFGKLQGRAGLGAAAAISIQDDTGCTLMSGATGAAGTQIDHIRFGEVIYRDAIGGRVMAISQATVGKLSVGMFDVLMGNVTGAVGISITGGANIGTIDIDTLMVSAAAYSSLVYGLLQDAAIGTINIRNFVPKNIGHGFIQGTNASTGTAIQIGTHNTINCGQGVVIKKNSTVLMIDKAIRNGYQSSPWLQLDGNTEVNIPSGYGLYSTDAFGGSASSIALKNCAGIGVDVGRTGIARQQGAVAYHRTATARGTLVDGNLVVCDSTGTTGSWHQMAIPTNVY